MKRLSYTIPSSSQTL